jgi:AI-2 transport protein TqsA
MDSMKTINILLTVIVICLVGLLIKLAQTLIISLLIAVLLAYIMDPLMAFFRHLRLPLMLSILITALVFLSAFTGFGVIFYQSMLDFAKELPGYQSKLMSMLNVLLSRLPLVTGEQIKTNIIQEFKNIRLASLVLSAAGSIANILSSFFVVFLYAILFLIGKYTLTRKLLRSFPRPSAKRIVLILRRIDSDLREYIGIKTLMSLFVGVGSGIILVLFGTEFAIVLGFLTFLLNFIPYLGSAIAVALPPLIVLVQTQSPVRVLWLVVCLLLIQNLIAQVVEPRTVGRRLNLSIVVVFLTLLFWGWLWGAPVVILAIPMTTSLKIVMENIPAFRPFALLLEKMPRRRSRRRRHPRPERQRPERHRPERQRPERHQTGKPI